MQDEHDDEEQLVHIDGIQNSKYVEELLGEMHDEHDDEEQVVHTDRIQNTIEYTNVTIQDEKEIEFILYKG